MTGRRMSVKVLAGSVLLTGAWGNTALCAGQEAALPGWRLAEDYSRELFKPFEKYNYDSVHAMVEKIRAEGHPIPTGHPRIFINEKNKAALRQKIARHHKEIMQEAVSIADKNHGGKLTSLGGHSREPAAQPVVLACGIIYQLGRIPGVRYSHSPEGYGRDGVRHLLSLLKGRYEHREYLGLPLGYDWLYELMTEEERKIVAAQLLENAQPEKSLVNPYNNPAGARLLGALAVFGDAPRAKELLEQFHNGMVFGDKPGRYHGTNIMGNHIFVPEGPGSEGIGYSHWYNPFYPFLEAWFDQTGEDYFKLPFFQNWVFHETYITGNEYEHQDKYAKGARKAWSLGCPLVNTMYDMSIARSNRTAASLAKYHHQGDRLPYVRSSVKMIYMLRADPSVPAKSPEELRLPTTAHFRVVNSIFARNSWKGIETTWVWFQSPTWQNVRDLGPANDFIIWKYGGFVITKRTQAHDYDGGNRTNTFVLYDRKAPGKTFIIRNCMDRAFNRGLGRRINSLREVDTSLPGYNKGLRYFEERPGEYLYCLGDGAQVFDEGRLKDWSRQFIWFRVDRNDKTDHFVVFDRIEKANDGVTEHMLLNFNMKPQIRDRKANRSLGEGKMKVKGIWTYEDADRIVATNTVKTGWGQAHGRAFVDTLLPRDRVYYRMGGGQERNIDLFGDLRKKRMRTGPLAGEWRVQMTGKSNSVKQVYLHTIQAVDMKVEKPEPTALLEGAGLVGARTGPNIVLFSPKESTVRSGRMKVAFGGTFRLLICDLEPGAKYSVSLGGKTVRAAATSQGTCFFRRVGLKQGDTIAVGR